MQQIIWHVSGAWAEIVYKLGVYGKPFFKSFEKQRKKLGKIIKRLVYPKKKGKGLHGSQRVQELIAWLRLG